MRPCSLRAGKSPKAMTFHLSSCCSDIGCQSPTHLNRNTTTQTVNLDRNVRCSSTDEHVPRGAQQVGDAPSTLSATALEKLDQERNHIILEKTKHVPTSADGSPYSRLAPSSLMSLAQSSLMSPIDQGKAKIRSRQREDDEASDVSMVPSSLMSSKPRRSDRLQSSQKVGEAVKEAFSPLPVPKFATEDASPVDGTSHTAFDRAIQGMRNSGATIMAEAAAARSSIRRQAAATKAADDLDDGVPLEEVPYAAGNIVVPPGGESNISHIDQQLQVAEQLQEPGAHQKLRVRNTEAAEQRAAAPEVQATSMAGEGAHMVGPLMANTWLSPRGPGGRSGSVVELTRAQTGPTLEEREEKGEVLTTVDIDTECEVLAALVAADTQDSDDTRPTPEQKPDQFDRDDFQEITMDADDDATTSPEGRQPDQAKGSAAKHGASSSSGASSHPSASASKGAVAESPAEIAGRLDAAKVAGHGKLVKAKGSGNMPPARVQFQIKHWDELRDTCLSAWTCDCRLAKNRGQPSCLRQFSPEQMTAFYKETVGPEPGKRSVNEVALRVHRLLWEMKEPLATDAPQRDKGAKYQIIDWKLDGRPVCRSAWEKTYCVSAWTVRSAYGLVRRGHKPADVESSQEAERLSRLLAKTIDADGKVDNERRGFAVTWWKNLLLLMDWLPNEQRVQLRGPGFKFLHTSIYGPAATRCGMKLEYRAWRKCVPAALKELCRLLPGADPAKLKCSRSARHSKFPECTECKTRRDAWIKAAKLAGSDPAEVARLYHELLEHNQDWQADRQVALQLRRDMYNPDSAAGVYENDDKCGSHWCKLIVCEGGRDTKRCAKAKYTFSIQANVVCGEGGSMRFAAIPENVQTGGNFGLTNLIMTIYRSFKAGRFKPQTRLLLRHTDGGGDNVTYITHIVHWLLVYLGVVDEIVWFRFEAGHSHTEISDRLFGIMKRIFESDSGSRVERCATFGDLWKKVEAMLKSAPELRHYEHGLANWDIDRWLRGMVNESGANMFDGKLARYTFDNVYRYKYVGVVLPEHGGVHVTYKHRLSHTKTDDDAEWAPVEAKTTPSADGSAPPVTKNVTTEKGIIYIPFPPDLSNEAPFEAYKTKHAEELKPAASISSILRMHKNDLSQQEMCEWEALRNVHESGRLHSSALPMLPHRQVVQPGADCDWLPTGQQFEQTFQGTPCLLKPILEEMAFRYPRPLINWKIFDEPPPTEWPTRDTLVEGGDADELNVSGSRLGERSQQKRQRRDPAEVNSVEHLEYRANQRQRVEASFLDKRWVNEQPNRVSSVVDGGFYFVELDKWTKGEPWLALGLVQVRRDAATDTLEMWWYGRASETSNPVWPNVVLFKPWPTEENQSKEELDLKCVRIEMTTEWVPPTEGDNQKGRKMNAQYRRRLELFADHHGLLNHESAATHPKAKKPKKSSAAGQTGASEECAAVGSSSADTAKASTATQKATTSKQGTKPAARKATAAAPARAAAKKATVAPAPTGAAPAGAAPAGAAAKEAVAPAPTRAAPAGAAAKKVAAAPTRVAPKRAAAAPVPAPAGPAGIPKGKRQRS